MTVDLRKGPSGPPVSLDSNSIVNESTLPGTTLTDVLDIIDDAGVAVPPGYPPPDSGGSAPDTAGRPGYVSRRGYVNAASLKIGTTFAGVVLEAAPVAWLTERDLPPGGEFEFRQFGPASGGGSGCACRGASGTASFNGGGPSGGGALNIWRVSRAALIAALPIFFNVPLGGAGGVPVVSNAITETDGNPGTSATINSVLGTGLVETAGAGTAGLGGASTTTGAAGSGGGTLGNGISNTQGGAPYDQGVTVASTAFNLFGGARSNTRNTTGASGVSQYAIWGGAGGGSNGNSSTIVYGGRSKYGGGGGGHGGRYSLVGGLIAQVGEGGNHDVNTVGIPWGGGGGTAGSTSGQSGGNGADGNESRCGEGGGGGMAAFGSTSGTAIGGNGGDGGFPGGGAGGGGTGFSNGLSGQVATSGRGGKGGDSLTLVTGY